MKMMKKTIHLLLFLFLFLLILSGCNENNTENDFQQIAQIEIYSSEGNLINTITDEYILQQYSSLEYTDILSDSEQNEKRNEINHIDVLCTIISYKAPVAVISNGSLEKLVELTIYEDSNIVKQQIAPENVKVAPISEEYLTFYMTISDEDKDFILSLLEL